MSRRIPALPRGITSPYSVSSRPRRPLMPGATTCNVMETDSSYEAKANHGAQMDVWRLDFSVHNGTGSWLDHLIARFGIASEWPDCTNWSGPDVFRLREINPSVPLIDMTVDWTDTAGHIQRSGRNVVAPGATLTDTEFIIKLRRDPAPRFVNWCVDYRLGSASTTGADARLDPRAVEAALGLDRPTRRLIQERLLAAGFDPGVADGLFGPVTRSVIRRWQAARGVAATGYLDSAGAAQLRAAVEGAGREVQRQFAPVADAERQAARRRTLRRLAQVLDGGTHRVEADAQARAELEADAPRRANPPAAPVRPRADRPLPAEVATTEPIETTSTPAAGAGFCGLAVDAPVYIVVRNHTNRMSKPSWYACPAGPAPGCKLLSTFATNPVDSDYIAEGARYAAGMGGEHHCEFRTTQELRGGRLDHFPRAEHDGQRLRLLRGGDHVVEGPPLLKRDPIEEAERRHGDEQRARCQSAFGGQVDLVGADLLGAEAFGGPVEVAGEPRDGLDVRALGERR